MRTKAKPRKSKPRQRQLGLFDDPKPEPKISPKWKQPRHSKSEDPRWACTWIDPVKLGIKVEIPKWLESRKPK